MLLTDLCNRPSTRAPVDRSTTGRATFIALTAECFPPGGGSPTRHRTTLRRSGPGWPAFDDACDQLRSLGSLGSASSPLGDRCVGESVDSRTAGALSSPVVLPE